MELLLNKTVQNINFYAKIRFFANKWLKMQKGSIFIEPFWKI
jgi:hypothetical protein